ACGKLPAPWSRARCWSTRQSCHPPDHAEPSRRGWPLPAGNAVFSRHLLWSALPSGTLLAQREKSLQAIFYGVPSLAATPSGTLLAQREKSLQAIFLFVACACSQLPTGPFFRGPGYMATAGVIC